MDSTLKISPLEPLLDEGLTWRAFSALVDALGHDATLDDVCGKSRSDLLKIRRFGRASLRSLEAVLENRGRHLAGEPRRAVGALFSVTALGPGEAGYELHLAAEDANGEALGREIAQYITGENFGRRTLVAVRLVRR